MAALYLWFNAVMYVGFSIFCALNLTKSSFAVGFESLSNSGKSEYLVAYGGMQLGFAFFYAYSAMRPDMRAFGLLFSIFIYLGIVAYRVASLYLFGPLSTLTNSIAVLEVLLLLAAVGIYYRDYVRQH